LTPSSTDSICWWSSRGWVVLVRSSAVQIHAAGVNLLDSKLRNGEFKRILPYRLPLILGHDVAGVVVRVGARVRRFKPGDEVYARPADGRIGAFAEFIAIKEDDVAYVEAGRAKGKYH
jgi:NADPH:quinone reductase-like Zn-dependent oxidoreductase